MYLSKRQGTLYLSKREANLFLSKRVVGHMALGVGGPGSIPPWRALSKSLTFLSKSMINANIRPSELQKVTFLTTDESLVQGLA